MSGPGPWDGQSREYRGLFGLFRFFRDLKGLRDAMPPFGGVGGPITLSEAEAYDGLVARLADAVTAEYDIAWTPAEPAHVDRRHARYTSQRAVWPTDLTTYPGGETRLSDVLIGALRREGRGPAPEQHPFPQQAGSPFDIPPHVRDLMASGANAEGSASFFSSGLALAVPDQGGGTLHVQSVDGRTALFATARLTTGDR